MPEEGIRKVEHYSILSLEEIARLVRVASSLGIRKVRLTGGEPLIRKNIVQLVGDIASLPEIDDLALTTNGMLFNSMACDLQKAGLKRVNFSMDTMVAEKFKYITRGGDLEKVSTAIFKALELGMEPVKINTVIIRGFNDSEIMDFADLVYQYPLHIRFIEFMPVGDLFYWKPERVMQVDEIKTRIEQEYELYEGSKIEGNGPAKYYHMRKGKGTIGFISPMSNHFCASCNRIRMTADGSLRGCLYEKAEINLKSALLAGAGEDELRELFLKTIVNKAPRHQMNSGWGSDNKRMMYQIGG
jgi:cyclic pyranopterin phosphate synthase